MIHITYLCIFKKLLLLIKHHFSLKNIDFLDCLLRTTSSGADKLVPVVPPVETFLEFLLYLIPLDKGYFVSCWIKGGKY